MVLVGVAGGGTSLMSWWMMYASCRQSADTVAKMPWISIVCVLSPLWQTLYVLMRLAGATERTMP